MGKHMNLKKINDFRSKPSVVEYLSLYITSSTFVICGSASVLGNLSSHWAMLSLAGFLVCCACLRMLKQTRDSRAEAFYGEWLIALNPKEIVELKNRLNDQCPEKHLLSRLVR
jgi:hypothetical protein